MIRSSILHKATRHYCYAVAAGDFRIRIITAKGDINKITLHTREKYLDPAFIDTTGSAPMELIASDEVHDYYEAAINIDMICLRYYFELEDMNGERLYFGDDHFMTDEPQDIEDMFDCPQTMREEGHPEVPEWAVGKVVYQIFPTRFATDKAVDPEEWYKVPLAFDAKLGGNLRGIINKLDYIKDLGADVIYLTPIFKADTQHKYDTVDYYQIDPELGTEDDLRELVDKVHEMGMYILLDGVFNHSSKRFFAFQDVIEKGESSKYKDWYYATEFPISSGSRQELPNYKTFGYVGMMPKLNMSNPETAEYFIKVVCHYLKKFKIDGWRLDVADEVGHRFWKNMRAAARAVNPDALIVGEDWHLCEDFLEGDEWDSCMNYAWFKALKSYYMGKESLSEFTSRLGQIRGRYHSNVYPVLWNIMDSHDYARFFTHVCGNRDVERLLSAAAMTVLLPGMPFIYYGDEAGMEGSWDPDNRRGMLWDESRRNEAVYEGYRKLTSFRHAHPELWRELPKVEHLSEESHVLVLRQKNLLLAFNMGDGEVDLAAEVPALAGRPAVLELGATTATGTLKLGRFGVAVFEV